MTAEVQLPPSTAFASCPRRRRKPMVSVLAVVLTTGTGLALAVAAAAGAAVATAAELALVIGLVGSFIGWHRPGERIGRLMVGTGIAFAVGLLAVAMLALSAGAAGVPAGVLQTGLFVRWLTVALPVPWALLVAWFPDGRFIHRGWAVLVAVGGVVAVLVAVLGYLFSPTGDVPGVLSGTPQSAGLVGPFPSPHAAALQTVGAAIAVLPLLLVPALVARYRKAGPLVRQQVRWLLLGAVGAIAGAGLAAVLGGSTLPGVAVALVTQPMPAMAITVAVLRYRLWEIDIVISRAVVYAVLWAALSVLLVVPALAAGLFVGGSAALAAVGIALLVTVAFQPARRRLERLVEQIAYRHRPRGYTLLAHLGRQLRSDGDVGAATVHRLREGLGVSWAGIWVRVELDGRQALRSLDASPEGSTGSTTLLPARVADWLRQVTGPITRPPRELQGLWPGPAVVLVPLSTGTELVGLLACGDRPGDPLGAADLELLDALGHECALALRTRRLELELRERLALIETQSAELRRSRQRLVAAQDEQRRRIERDLHDGVQQQLVALAAGLRRLCSNPPQDLVNRLPHLATEAEEAVFALQDLARGIFPSILADRGLAAALHTQAGRSPLAVRVEVEPGLNGCRLGQELESSLYFVAMEALTNAAKHAPAARVTLQLRRAADSDGVVLEVHDDGPGFAPGRSTPGSGLQNMHDRVAAVGGDVFVDSRPGAGTWVRAEVPIPHDNGVLALGSRGLS